MTLDIPKNIQTNIGNLLGSERDHAQYIFEYVRLVFSNPALTVKDYQENKLLEPTINKWVKDWLLKHDAASFGGQEFAEGFFRAVCYTNNDNWYLKGQDMEYVFSQSQRNYFLFTEDWIPIIESWYILFRPYFALDSGERYYWAKNLDGYFRSSLSAETVRWWYNYFKDSVDVDGDPYMQYGMNEFLAFSRFTPLDVLVAYSEDERSRHLAIDEVLRYNYNLQTIEDFRLLGKIKHDSDESLFKSWEENRLDLDYYLMNRAANPEILEEILSAGWVGADWDYLSLCLTIDYAFMTKHGVVDWLKSHINLHSFYEKLAIIIANSNLSEADIQHLTRQTLSGVEYINWKTDHLVLDFLPQPFVKKTFDNQNRHYSKGKNSDFYYEYNCCLLAYLSNPNIEPRRDSTGQLDFNFLTGTNVEDLLHCPNNPASPFYFLSTSTFTNPAFTRQDLLDFMSYWEHLIAIGGATIDTIATWPMERVAHFMIGTSLNVESDVDIVNLYNEHIAHADGNGYLLTGLFFADKLQIRDLVNYLEWDKNFHNDTKFNPFYQCYLLANPNIYRDTSVGLFNWWGSVVR